MDLMLHLQRAFERLAAPVPRSLGVAPQRAIGCYQVWRGERKLLRRVRVA